MTIVITIPGRPPTPNSRRHWRKVHKDNAVWSYRAWTEATLQKPHGMEPLTSCRMAVEFVVPTKGRRDLDNMISGQKPCLDGLVLAGILADDSTAVITSVAYSSTYVKGVTATRYTIEPLGGNSDRLDCEETP